MEISKTFTTACRFELWCSCD